MQTIKLSRTVVGIAPRIVINVLAGSKDVTYDARESIKRCFGRWEPQRRIWTLPFTSMALDNIGQRLTAQFPNAEVVISDELEGLAKNLIDIVHVQNSNFERAVLPPYAHQMQGSSMIGQMSGVMLNWDMGSGKTKAVFDAIIEYGFMLNLIVCPSSVISVWRKQSKMHLPADFPFKLLELDGKRSVAWRGDQVLKQARDCRTMRMPLLVVINYEALWRKGFGNKVEDMPWDLVVADESQRISNAFSKVGAFMGKRLGPNAKHRVCLSGTPMGNGAQDLFGQMSFCEPALFGESFTRFRSQYCIMGGFENRQVVDQQNVEELSDKLSLISTRVELSDVVDLPPFVDNELLVSISKEARKVYQDLKDEFVSEVDEGVITASNALTKLLRLQQITSGFAMVEDEDNEGVTRKIELDRAKAEALQELFEEAPKTEPFVVFCRFKHDLEEVRRCAVSANRPCWDLSGAGNDQDAWERDSRNGLGPVIAVQLQAGGSGIDLTAARYCVYYSLSFSLNDYAQSRARVYRPGQERSVFYYHLIAAGTIDRVVYRALSKKQNVVDAILEGITDAEL